MSNMRNLAWLTSFLVGFVSLGQEILWIRISGFANGNSPQNFAMVLSLFLLGIVLGSLKGKSICQAASTLMEIRRNGSAVLAISALIDFGSPYLMIQLGGGSIWLTLVMALLILSSAATKAVLFPIVHHLGSRIEAADTGSSIARVYFFNILGATASPILIGFWLLDHFSAQTMMQLLALLTLLLAFKFYPWGALATTLSGLFVAGMIFAIASQRDNALMHALATKGPDQEIGFLHENRQGVIHTARDPVLGDAVYGGNIYDGRLSTDLVVNGNRIDRAYVLAALHPAPRRVLVIGMSSGASTRVLSGIDGVEHVDVIEINPGYLDLIRATSEIKDILHDHRIHIHIDDGRRWLKRHDTETYDLIFMNTTFHWRAYSTNLLSKEFLQLVRQHLAPGGILAFNGTGSPDTLATAAAAFKYAYRWRNSNFVYAAEFDFRKPSIVEAEKSLRTLTEKLRHQEKHVEKEIQASIERVLSTGWVDVTQEARLAGRPLEIITDNNLLTEYRYGRDAWW